MVFGIILLLFYPALILIDQGNLIIGTFGSMMLYVGYGCFLLATVYTPAGAGWLGKWFEGYTARTLAFTGFFSYPIYLWHLEFNYPLEILLRRFPLTNLPAEIRWSGIFVLYTVLATAIGVVFGLLLEKPSLALRDRLFPSRTAKPVRPQQMIEIR